MNTLLSGIVHQEPRRAHNAGPLAVLERVGGFGYHHPSAEDAWRRIFGFFARHLHDGNPTTD